jgi:hypothetical protein
MYQAEPLPMPFPLATPAKLSTDSQYLGHAFWTQQSLYQAVSGWEVGTVRGAIDAHDAGSFWNSSALAVVVSRYPWIGGPLGQREAPPLGLTREVYIPDGTDRGKSRIAATEFSAIMTENEWLFGDIFRPHAMIGFSLLQHTWVYDRETKTQVPITSVFPTSAVRWNSWSKRLQAFTLDGPIDIIDGDGKWSIVGTGAQPHIRGAIRMLGMPWASSASAERDESALSEYLGRMCPIAILPGGKKDDVVITPGSEEGKQTLEALKNLGKARSGGMFAGGTTITTLSNVDAGAAALLAGLLERRAKGMAIALLGTDSTTVAPSVYLSPSLAGVSLAKAREDVTHAGRAWSQLGSHYGEINYGLTPAQSPSYRWLLPDPTEADRRKATGASYVTAAQIVTAERAAGLDVTKERIAAIYADQGIAAPTLPTAAAKGEIFGYHYQAGVVALDEGRERLGLDALPGGVGSKEALAAHILAVRAAEIAAAQGGAPKQAAPAEPAPEEG